MNALPMLPCLGSNVRRTSRALTQLYEQALRPLDLRATQFTILQALSFTGEILQGRMGEILVMDSTTLTRTLAILIREGWVAERKGEDKRERWVKLTRGGDAQLKQALRAWGKVQARLRGRIGDAKWEEFMKLNQQIATIAIEEGETL